MATHSLQKASVCGVPGVDYRVRYYPEAANQSFKAGEFVYLSSGKVTVCADDATSIAGMALEDASGTTNTDIAVAVPIQGRTEFEMNVYHSTQASAVTAITQVTSRYGLQVDSNEHYCDIEDTTNLAFLVTSIVEKPGYSVGDVYGRVRVQILDEVSQLSGRDNA